MSSTGARKKSLYVNALTDKKFVHNCEHLDSLSPQDARQDVLNLVASIFDSSIFHLATTE